MKTPKPLFRSERVSSRSYERYLKQQCRAEELVTDGGKRFWREKKDRPSKQVALGRAVGLFLAMRATTQIEAPNAPAQGPGV